MNKKLSLIIALAMSITISSPSLAASTNAVTTPQTTITDTVNLSTNFTLEEALNSIEKYNTSIQLMDQKLILLNKQYDYDHQNAIDADKMLYSVNKNENLYISLKQAIEIKPQQSAQAVKDAKHEKEDALKALKFNMKRQYMNVINYQDQITNINNSISNIDKQIEKVNNLIKQGMATSSDLQQLNVQRSQLVAALNGPKALIEQSVLTVKQILNTDLNANLTLAPAKIDFVKFDDSNIEARINKSIEDDYDLANINRNIEWAKMNVDLNTKYGHNNTTGLVNAQLNLQNAINTLDDTTLKLKIRAWSSYYNMKNKEDSITAEQINLQNARENYNNASAKFEVGQVDQLEVYSKKLALEKEELTVQNLVNDYMVTVEEFKDLLGE
ncbi:TolC family protein [Clostridium sp. A1-XYC3]|uniref:TolC family protein n=1 Tax=Clostridium tanneri TaxID=3037988 RepID=A0ABU4JWR6_9CLOT|nr:TolC family protein [Clostridium sp. A1-XYC3]MDW8802585.1 TolC family protein [Clostridium sp. A1-XYC3]